jgi:opacity protein-like surface antigen
MMGTVMTASAMTRTSVALLFCVAAGAAGNAHAQNYDSAGLLRFGAFGSWAVVNSDRLHQITNAGADPAVVASAALATGSRSEDSFGFGLSFGYDLLLPHAWLIGFEVDGAIDNWQDDRHSRELGIDYRATLRGRLGTYVRPDVLLYATAGVSFLGIQYKRTEDFILANLNSEIPFDSGRTLSGGVVGAGVEYDWAHMSLFAEYLYATYNTFSANDSIVTNLNNGAVLSRERIRADLDEHLLRLGVKFKIGYDFLEGPLY